MDKSLNNDERNFIRNERIKEVMAQLVVGKYRWEIMEDLGKKWNVNIDAMNGYIRDAKSLMKSHFSEEEVIDILSKYNYLYQDALKRGDKKLAVKILDSISKVGGYITNKLDVTSGGDKITTIINIIKPEDKKDGDTI